jgi:hypothetical protein
MLTEQEMDQLKSLMDRAIANGQIQIGVLSPFDAPTEDIFDEGDRHDGFCAMNDEWKTWSMMSSEDDGPETPLLKLLIDQRSADYVTNGVMV